MGLQTAAVADRRLSPRLIRLGASGDPGEAIDNVNTAPLPDGAKCFVIENRADYTLDKESTATPDGDAVIAPAAGGPGRWLKVIEGGGAGSVVQRVSQEGPGSVLGPQTTSFTDLGASFPPITLTGVKVGNKVTARFIASITFATATVGYNMQLVASEGGGPDFTVAAATPTSTRLEAPSTNSFGDFVELEGEFIASDSTVEIDTQWLVQTTAQVLVLIGSPAGGQTRLEVREIEV